MVLKHVGLYEATVNVHEIMVRGAVQSIQDAFVWFYWRNDAPSPPPSTQDALKKKS